jgi:hypothetical protein
MQPSSDLAAFIAAAKAKGASDESLIALLKQAGWPVRDVLAALRRYYEETTGIALPARGSSGESAREAFLHLLAFCTLATWTVALGSLLFTLIEYAFPDPVMVQRGYLHIRYSVATEMASLFVAFPIYLLINRIIFRESAKRPAAVESGVTRWLTWLALLIAAGVIIGDLITFLAWFLRGELSVRFVLKVLVVGVLAAGVFWYYLGSLGMVRRLSNRLFATAATACIVASIVGGFLVTGSPDRQRAFTADQRRIEHLQRFANDAHAQWAGTQTLPNTLPSNLRDPVTGQPYEYRPLSGPSYQICAVFETEGDSETRYRARTWHHPAGRHCYTFDARVLP